MTRVGESSPKVLELVDTPRETFCGFDSVEAVRNKLTRLQADLPRDINLAYADEFVTAAAALEHYAPAEYARLCVRLKGQGLGLGRWESATRALARQERERITKKLEAAQAAIPKVLRSGSGQPLELHDPVPWEQPVEGALLIEDIAAMIRRFAIVDRSAVHAIALWIIFTYLIDEFDIAPRLDIHSPVMRCGKTRLLKPLAELVRRPLSCSNISAAAIYRTIDDVQPSLLMDEADTYISIKRGGNESSGEEIRGILNSGHDRKHAFVIRSVPRGDGAFESRKFSTFCPIVTALIGQLPTTLRDRSISITMRRKLTSEKVEKFGGRHKKRNEAQAQELARRIARWAQNNRDRIAQAEPNLPDSLDDRAADNWTPLLAIADAIGAGWPELARKAALALSGADAAGADGSLGIKLLADIHGILEDAPGDDIGSTELCEKLVALDLSPWATLSRAKPLTANRLTRMLGPFEVYPKKTAMRNAYSRADLEEVFERYAAVPCGHQISKPPQLLGGVAQNDDSKAPRDGGLRSAVNDTERGVNGDMEVLNGNMGIGALEEAEIDRPAVADAALGNEGLNGSEHDDVVDDDERERES
jgi:Protein of unknown function (DUF3631)